MGPANTKVRVQEPGHILWLTPTDEVTYAEIEQTALYLAEKYWHQSPMRVLVDARGVAVRVTPQEILRFTELLTGLRGFIEARIAVLHDAAFNPFAATDRAVLKSGFALQRFVSEPAASRWLCSQEAVPGPV